MRIDVNLNERVLVHKDGRPARYLGPGRHRVWAPFHKLELVRFATDAILAELRPEQLALVPAEDLMIVRLEEHQRALVLRRGRPALWLGAGEHQIWTVLKAPARGEQPERALIEVRVIDTRAMVTAPLADEVKAVVRAGDYAEVTAPEGTVALRFVDGVLDAVLGAGRHAAWTTLHKVVFSAIDLRERVLQIAGQEVMTKDRVSLRLNLAASYKVADPRRMASVAREPDDVLYLAIQLAVREAIALKSLDELLASREAVGASLLPGIRERAEVLGLEVVGFGVKDVVLPGDMKSLLNRVIEAQKEAEANVILRREEVAAVRSMAQTAKVLSENPLLLRLKELEAYKELAGKVGRLNVTLGDGVGPKLSLGS
jgi:regulator of protease activity HflC (stomatin/prohibitin superfamily)